MITDRINAHSGGALEDSSQLKSSFSVSSNPASSVVMGLGLSLAELKGKRVLDVASGLSDFTMRASEAGAEIVAVDPLYSDKEALGNRGRIFITDQVERAYRMQGGGIVIPGDRHPDDIALEQDMRGGTLARAIDDIANNPQRYVSADILDLPFANGAFDMATCFSFLTSFEGDHPEFVKEALIEVLRVIRRGGNLRVGPNEFKLEGGESGRKTEANLKAAFEEAKKLKIVEKISRYSIGDGMFWYNISRSRKR